jgi:hypothetical protein
MPQVRFPVTLRAAVIDRAQLPVPVHAPLHPLNVKPLAATAVRATEVEEAKEALHVLPQLIPAGFELICPLPLTFTFRA